MSEKLQKVLAQTGLASRREIERWIAAGRITINYIPAKLGDRIDAQSHIEIDGKPIKIVAKKSTTPVVLMYHKPLAELCTRHDPEGRPTVFDRLPKPPAGRWVMVGRLDFNTSGLLLFTNDGELANQLMHPSTHLTRTYAVRVYGRVSANILARLKTGVMLEDGKAHFATITTMNSDGKNQWYEVTVTMGRNRIVRRLWESQGIKVSRLMRIAFGHLTLPRSLKAGEYKLLTTQEVEVLRKTSTKN